MVIYLSLLVAVIGGLMFGLADGKLSELGKILLFSGTLAFLLQMAPHPIPVIR